jgi:acyl-CoA synthetase (AMP-forming)/AMP-acid ligase II
MQHGLCPKLDELLDSAPVKAYPMGKTFEEAANDTFLILHSSGTTGLPKPIRITHAQIAANDSLCQLPEECDCGGPGFRRISPITECAGRLIVPFAPFHVISAVILMCLTVFGKSTYVFGPADRSMTASDLLDAIEYGNGDCTFCSPALLEKYASSRDDMKRLGKLSTICYGGGKYCRRGARRFAPAGSS